MQALLLLGGVTMCGHLWIEINDIRVCKRCGMTISLIDGKVMFDRKFANIGHKKGRKKK